MPLVVGAPAPDFTLKSSRMEDVHLQALRGRAVLLLFFPLAFTPTCTLEFGIVQSRLEAIHTAGGEVLGISADSPFSLARWAEDEGYTLTLLSDFGKETLRAYDVIYDRLVGLPGVPRRAAFLLDAAGRLVRAEVLERAGDLPDLDGFIGDLQAMR